jgi:hypothetical protein
MMMKKWFLAIVIATITPEFLFGQGRPLSNPNGIMPIEKSTKADISPDVASSQTCSMMGQSVSYGWASNLRAELSARWASGDVSVGLTFAALPGKVDELARKITAIGGEVRFLDRKVDYLRAQIPMKAICDNILPYQLVEAIDVDLIPTLDYDSGVQSPEAAKRASEISQRQRLVTPEFKAGNDPRIVHPYSPVADLNALTLLKQHPTYDGRGVNIAYIDWVTPDILVPELRVATSLDGKPIDKIANISSAVDPRETRSAPSNLVNWTYNWVAMDTEVQSVNDIIIFKGKQYRVPHPGVFRMGLFREPQPGAYPGQVYGWDADRNGEFENEFGVLWDKNTGEVWIDTERKGDFGRYKPLHDYSLNHDIGLFGQDDPGSVLRKTLPFAIEIDKDNNAIALNIGESLHGTEVAPAAAANGGSKGRFTGVAPGAQYAFWSSGISTQGETEAVIRTIEDPSVDIVVYEPNGLVNGLGLPLGGRSARALILSRLARRYKKPILVIGGNNPGLEITTDVATGSNVMSIGGYQSQESYRRNFGFLVNNTDNLHWGALAHGPAGDGGLKPDVLAPSGHLGNFLGYISSDSGAHAIAPGYSIGGGTSQATPTAGGAYALLISAAKQAGIPYDAERLNYAVRNSARFIPEIAAYKQGNGLIDVEAAWNLLKKLTVHPPLTIEVSAPVNTVLGPFLRDPNRGRGIFEREGWTAGTAGSRLLSIKRTSGAKTLLSFQCRWIGNEGTFSGPSSLALPLDQEMKYPVTIKAKEVGVHSAILACRNLEIPGDAVRVLNTIVAADDLASAPQHRIERELLAKPPDSPSLFINVPPGAKQLRIRGVTTGRRILIVPIGPDGDSGQAYHRSRKTCGPTQQDQERSSVYECDIPYPEPGVWELVANMSDQIRLDYMEGTLGPEHPKTLPNLPIRISVALETSGPDIVEAHEIRGRIAAGNQELFFVDIGKDLQELNVRLTSDDPQGALGVFAINCTHIRCSGDGSISVARGSHHPVKELHLNAESGRWALVVDAGEEPFGKTFNYLLTYGQRGPTNY